MKPDIALIREHVQNFAFDDLLLEALGWKNYRNQFDVVVEDRRIPISAIAKNRSVVVCKVEEIPDYNIRRKIERQVSRKHYENIILYVDADHTRQVWQWVKRVHGKPLATRERQYRAGQSGEAVAQALAGIYTSLREEGNLTGVEVTSRVQAAFDVEKVTKKFYDRFKKQHNAFLKFIEGIPDSDFQRWYASVMLNRLMFIYFVQKKGFLDGDQNYLRNRLAQTEGNFYHNFLIPLFFEGFAKKNHSRDIKQLLGDVPYLNGGLFLPHQIEERYGDAIHIPNEAFEKLFDFFEEYQWHLDDRILEKDNEINPDVLGYIFEKYINQKQMGAYYTKEDITEYISQNTVIPFLFDEVRQAVRIAFEGEHTVWDLLVESPDDYIYPAMQHGTHLELPDEIAAGIDDVSQRSLWNTPAPSDYGLPTEIWRETVARRQRYFDIRGQLERGEVRQINDLITLNLNILLFAKNVLYFTDSPDIVRAFWKALNRVTVLDPTCGSGAFLFAALKILEPMYEAGLERMEGFLSDLDETAHPRTYSDFREVMERIDQHPNRRYFVLKSIIIQNLYGVDIMDEAVEIAKLRLFLKLVAQVEDKDKIEPLPDIDFNIRAGNTLVGFATRDEVERALSYNTSLKASDGEMQMKLISAEDEERLAEIERKAQNIDRLFGLFRQQQTELGGEVRPEDKAELKRRLGELETELNYLLAGQYGVDPSRDTKFEKWRKAHEPFHWFIEFYGVLKTGGFDVIIGNPPYVEYRTIKKEYRILNYLTEPCGNLYAYIIERCVAIAREARSRVGMIIPVASVCTGRYQTLQELLREGGSLFISSYNDRPGKLFEGLEHIRLSIVLWEATKSVEESINTTKYNKWYTDIRETLFKTLEFTSAKSHVEPESIPKLHKPIEHDILEKVFAQNKTLGDFIRRDEKHIVYYTRKLSGFVQVLSFIPAIYLEDGTKREPSELKTLKFNNQQYRDIALAVLNSSIFYWMLTLYSDCRNLNKREVISVPIDMQSVSADIIHSLTRLSEQLMDDLEHNSSFLEMNYKKWGLMRIQAFYPKYSKDVIDEIDRVLARHYGFTDEELDFIINYDIKYRMGDDLFEEDEEETE